MARSSKPVVTFFHRKPREVGNYSVEFIFHDVRKRLKGLIEVRPMYSTYESSGFFKRFYNCIEANRRQTDVNHITGDINYLGLFLSGKRTIQTILDCVHLTNSSGIRHKILKLFWISIPVKKAAFVTAISESTKQEILKYSNCDPGKIKVIYVAISERFKRKDKPFNQEFPRILQIGTAPNKNIPALISALKDISCILEIIGKHNPEYEKLLKETGVKYEYKWGLSDEQMIERYEAADIISLVSTYEGFGMPILEAQAVGRPVITSNAYSMPEVAGGAAVLVDPHNISSIREGLLKIINDQDYRNGIIKKGFENIKRFDPDRIAGQYFDLYKKIIENN
jgi:glycosyltransferase involved in cell wall biosynthesis